VTDVLDAVHRRAMDQVGVVERQSLGPLSATEFARFAIATDDHNPRYQAGEDAIAPPLFLSSVLTWGAGAWQAELRKDGTGGTESVSLRLDGLRLMGGGQDLEFHRDIPAGTSVILETSIAGADLKEGKSGRLLLLHLQRTYTDEAGEALLTCRETFVAR
jgi:hypothetical protein